MTGHIQHSAPRPGPAASDAQPTRAARRYPKIVIDVIEELTQVVDGVEVPVDTSKPNPNTVEFDNLYLVRRCNCCHQAAPPAASYTQSYTPPTLQPRIGLPMPLPASASPP